MTKRVLITGVAGFIGSNLLDVLIDETDWEITGIDNLSTGNLENIKSHFNNQRFEFSEISCSQLLTLKPFNSIFHLAALPRIQPSFTQISEHVYANLMEAIHLIELMIKDSYFPKFVFSGSSSIYGTPSNFPTTELEKVDCLSPYAFQKYEVEKYLELISTRYPIDYVILRYFNPYGPRSFNPYNKFNAYSSVVGIFLNQHCTGVPLTITGNGRQKRDFIHVYDVAKANLYAAKTEKGLNQSFNVGFGKTMEIIELAKMISKNIVFVPERHGESLITWAEISKIKNLIGWTPKNNLEDYISNFLASNN